MGGAGSNFTGELIFLKSQIPNPVDVIHTVLKKLRIYTEEEYPQHNIPSSKKYIHCFE